jgi:recombination protein RecA
MAAKKAKTTTPENSEDITSVFKDVETILGEKMSMIASDLEDADRVSTGSLNLDLSIGGGFPKGHIIEIYGPYASGKTTIALMHAAVIQRENPEAWIVYVDAENTANNELMSAYGLDLARVYLIRSNQAEKIFDALYKFLNESRPALIIIDSVPALVPKRVEDGSAEDQNIALLPRLLSANLSKIRQKLRKADCTLILVNQIREKPGISYGTPEIRPCGRALGFYVSMDIEVRRGDLILEGTEQVGHQMKTKITKNKCSKHLNKVAQIPLYYGVGIDKVQEVADVLVEIGFIAKGGSYYKLIDADDKPLVRYIPDYLQENSETQALNFQGKNALLNYMRLDTDFFALLEKKCYGEEVTEAEIINAPLAELSA